MRKNISWAIGLSAVASLAAAAFADEPAVSAAPDGSVSADVDAGMADSEIYVYPAKGQSDSQVDRDRYECHNWAVKQTSFDPSQPRLAPHQQVKVVAMPPDHRDTVNGAVTGAVIGAAVSHPRDTAQGAVVGAVAGAVIGAASDSSRAQESAQIQTRMTAAEQAERARLEKQAFEYRRAISACLEGRGYTVK
jgi:uncharacterized protein YcfJ